MSKFHLEGGCHCGAIRYTLSEPALSVQHCHCECCKKVSGAMFGTGAAVNPTAVSITGEDNLTRYRSSPSMPEDFCKTCGCHLFAYEESEPDIMYILPYTLDGGVHPGHPADKEAHTYMSFKAQWDRTADDLPKYDTYSPDEIITGLQREENSELNGEST